MNTPTFRTAALALALLTTLSACKNRDEASEVPDATSAATPAAAPAGPAAPATETDASAAADVPANQAEAAAEAIPDSADAIWVAIDKHQAELKATIASGDLKNVHHHAFAIRDLVAALPTHSPQGTPEEQAKLKGEVEFVETLAQRLDASGDDGDQAATQASFDQLSAVLTGIARTK